MKTLPTPQKNLIMVFILFAVGFLVYGNSLRGEFQFDDHSYIVNNLNIHNLRNVANIWEDRQSRFLVMLSFALNYHFNHLDVWGYHVINVIIHILNAVCLWWLIGLIGRSPRLNGTRFSGSSGFIASAAALLFLVHPTQTQAVSYITQRFASMATLFYLLTLCCYVKGRICPDKKRAYLFFFLAIVSAISGMLSKEITVTLPFAVVLTEYFFLRPKTERTQIYSNKFRIALALILLSTLIVPYLYGIHYGFPAWFGSRASESHLGDIITAQNYWLTQLQVVTRYITLWFVPLGQNFDYDFPVSRSFFKLPTLTCFVFLCCLLALGFLFLRRKPVISFGIFFCFLAFSLESSFIPIRHVIFEHRAYLPSVGFCIAITAALFYALKNKTLFVLVMIAWIGMLGFLTVQRNKVWENEIVFWKDVISKSPFKSRGYDNLGAAYIRRNEYEQAVRQFEKALTLDPNNVETYSNLGQAYFQSGENEKALLHFQKASQIDPLSVAVLNNLGKIYEQMGNLQKAETLYLRAIQLKSSFLQPAYNLAGLYRETGKTDQALKIYHQIYEHYPYQTNSLIGMYDIYLKQGEASKAEALIMPLLKKVRSAEELTRLGSLSAQDKRVQEAFAFYLRALERNPEYAPAYIELGKLYGNLNQFDQAIAVWEEGMRRHSKNSEFPLLIKKAKNIRKSYH